MRAAQVHVDSCGPACGMMSTLQHYALLMVDVSVVPLECYHVSVDEMRLPLWECKSIHAAQHTYDALMSFI